MPGNSGRTKASTIVESSTKPPCRAAGQRHDARQRARRLHDRQLAVAAEGVLARELHDEVQALVLDAREGPRRIQAERAEDRLDLAPEILSSQLRVWPVQASAACSRSMPSAASAGSSTSFRQAYWSCTSCIARA